MLFVVDGFPAICLAPSCQQGKPKQKQTEKKPNDKMKTSEEFQIKDIFEQYGTIAKQYDCLCTLASRRQLTRGEMGFVRAFGDMLTGDAAQSEMIYAHRIWIDEEQHKTP